MGTGFNTEVLYQGVRYHVQTEDKGAPRYEIVTHIYVGGAILLTKRFSYQDQAHANNLAAWTQEMTTKQHKDILKVIQQEGIEKLRSGLEKENSKMAKPVPELNREIIGVPVTPAPEVNSPTGMIARSWLSTQPLSGDLAMRAIPNSSPDISQGIQGAGSPTPPVLRDMTEGRPSLAGGISLRLLDTADLRAGRHVLLRVLTSLNPDGIPVPNVKVIIQILGSSFRPTLFSGRTDTYGLFILDVTLPAFSVGQASLNILAVSEKFGMTELKYSIRQA